MAVAQRSVADSVSVRLRARQVERKFEIRVQTAHKLVELVRQLGEKLERTFATTAGVPLSVGRRRVGERVVSISIKQGAVLGQLLDALLSSVADRLGELVQIRLHVLLERFRERAQRLVQLGEAVGDRIPFLQANVERLGDHQR